MINRHIYKHRKDHPSQTNLPTSINNWLKKTSLVNLRCSFATASTDAASLMSNYSSFCPLFINRPYHEPIADNTHKIKTFPLSINKQTVYSLPAPIARIRITLYYVQIYSPHNSVQQVFVIWSGNRPNVHLNVPYNGAKKEVNCPSTCHFCAYCERGQNDTVNFGNTCINGHKILQ